MNRLYPDEIGNLDPIFVSDCMAEVPSFIDVILSVNNEVTQNGEPLNRIKNPRLIPYLHQPLNDPALERDFHDFELAVKFVLNKVVEGKKVLVHCSAGINRSPSVAVCAYAMFRGISIQEAVNIIVQTRQIFPCAMYYGMGQVLNKENCA